MVFEEKLQEIDHSVRVTGGLSNQSLEGRRSKSSNARAATPSLNNAAEICTPSRRRPAEPQESLIHLGHVRGFQIAELSIYLGCRVVGEVGIYNSHNDDMTTIELGAPLC
jgi:hypothetical protein